MYESGFFFFFTQMTAYERRISDWSSDVCSSDRPGTGGTKGAAPVAITAMSKPITSPVPSLTVRASRSIEVTAVSRTSRTRGSSYSPSGDRKSVGEGQGVSVRVDSGGRPLMKKKNKYTTTTNRQ